MSMEDYTINLPRGNIVMRGYPTREIEQCGGTVMMEVESVMVILGMEIVDGIVGSGYCLAWNAGVGIRRPLSVRRYTR